VDFEYGDNLPPVRATRQLDEVQAEFEEIFAQFSSSKTQALVQKVCNREGKRGGKR